ncbi:hypothetical protein MSIBF_A4410001 [groundwater metagenome]|uniref:Uncharacterized protein n=1 Tax=groundwater metagenome TaxID=717931 RepID=A0A098ECC3_9ZZZZ
MKNNTHNIDLLVFGDICIDYFYEVDNIPRLNESAKAITLKNFSEGWEQIQQLQPENLVWM